MSAKTSIQSAEVTPLPDALRALEVAIALGAEVAAPVKSFVHIVRVEIVDEDDPFNNYGYVVGVYQSVEAAKAGLVGWVLERWGDSGRSPFYDSWDNKEDEEDLDYEEAEKRYVEANSDDEILKAYFDASSDSYDIDKSYVKANAIRGDYAN